MNPDLLKGNLDMLLLSVLAEEPAHGYGIIERVRSTSNGIFNLPEGTVYSALHHLETQGLLTSRWSTAAPRRRRVYEITGSGHRALLEYREAWGRFSGAVRAVIAGTA
jgi:PadR family transcriptional regulator, regulatory protein PadR